MTGYFDKHQEQWFPQESKAVQQCESCGSDLFKGEDVIKSTDGDFFCDVDCFVSYAMEHDEITTTIIGE